MYKNNTTTRLLGGDQNKAKGSDDGGSCDVSSADGMHTLKKNGRERGWVGKPRDGFG